MQAFQRTTVRGPTFIRLLARLTDVDAPPSNESLSDRLSRWLDWTHAIALSTALDGEPSVPDADSPVSGDALEAECARVRATLTGAIVGDRLLSRPPTGAASRGPTPADLGNDYALFRQRYLTHQRSIQAATGAQRGHLRDRLAEASAELARLAEVDAVMELALSPREQSLLGTVPTLLGRHFDRLRKAGLADAGVADNGPAPAPGAWLDVFRKDMQSVLLAELDVRFQPVEGLLAALRTR